MTVPIAVQPQFWIFPLVATILVAAGLILLASSRKAKRGKERYTMDGDGRLFSGAITAILGAVAFVVWLILLIPYSPQYLMYYRVTGEVQNVTRSFQDGSGDMSTEPVVSIVGFDRPVVVGDSRIFQYVGERVDLTCSIEWVPYGEDRVSCFIAGVAS